MSVIDCFLTSDDLFKALQRDVTEGLTASPKTLPPKWFYDERGSILFEEITGLDEYYPTRRERAILGAHAGDIAAATGATTVLELGAGSGEKTRSLLDALAATLHSYIPVDVSGDFLVTSAQDIARDHPFVDVHPIVADYDRHLHLLPSPGGRLIVFLGGTIGNMEPAERIGFLSRLRATMQDDDSLLLGADLVKDPRRLVAAYDDARGVTAEFNRNVLRVLNRELDADFDLSHFEHVALWNDSQEWIEMRLRSTVRQRVRISRLSLDITLNAGEDIRTEISAKFRHRRLAVELEAAGLGLDHFWTDQDGDYSLSLARPIG